MKKQQFSKDQIQERKCEIWKARGNVGSFPEDAEKAAIASLEAEHFQPERLKKAMKQFGNKDDREFALKVKQFQWERLKTFISALGLAATIFAGVGLLLTYLNAQKEQQLNTERLITDRFTKAVEQLGHENIAVRIGGIYAIERIAKDSPKDHWTVMEVLTAFVRERSPARIVKSTRNIPLSSVTADVQSALTVIARQNTKGQSLHLDGTNLPNVNLYEANLQKAWLIGANLQRANLIGADLQGAAFDLANLQEVYFTKANLNGAGFVEANLRGAHLDDIRQLDQSFLCRTRMPNGIISNRDCKKVGYIGSVEK